MGETTESKKSSESTPLLSTSGGGSGGGGAPATVSPRSSPPTLVVATGPGPATGTTDQHGTGTDSQLPPSASAADAAATAAAMMGAYQQQLLQQQQQMNNANNPANQAFLLQLQQQYQHAASPTQHVYNSIDVQQQQQQAAAAMAAAYFAQQQQQGGGAAGGGGALPMPYPVYPFPPPPGMIGYPHPMQQQQQPSQQQQQQPPHSPKPPRQTARSSGSNNKRSTGGPSSSSSASSSSSRKNSTSAAAAAGDNNNTATTNAATMGGSGLPSLNDIFSGNTTSNSQQQQQIPYGYGIGQQYLAPITGNSNSGYGSISQQPQYQLTPPLSPQIYNAPPGGQQQQPLTSGGGTAPPRPHQSSTSRSKSPRGGRSALRGVGSNSNKNAILVRTGSSGELKRSSGNTAASAGQYKNRDDRHRRVMSDTPLKGLFGKSRHRRAGSDNVAFAPLPPTSSSTSNNNNRSRTLSNSSNSSIPRPRHRRGDSASSYFSVASVGDASMVSHRSNIAQSSLFGGVDAKTGRPLLHFPYEAIRLIMVPPTSDEEEEQKRINGGRFGHHHHRHPDGSLQLSDSQARRWSSSRNAYTLNNGIMMDGNGEVKNANTEVPCRRSAEMDAAATEGELERLFATGDVLPTLLTRGHLYAEHPQNVNALYEEYHRVSEQMEMGLLDEAAWESLEPHPYHPSGSKRRGSSDSNKAPSTSPLPPANYALAVSDDIYKKMIKEVSESRSMPCGLFFFGHHSDVSYPSIWIAATIVMLLFAVLFYLASYTDMYH